MFTLKHVRFVPVAMALCLCILTTSCGGGGGGGGGDDGGGGGGGQTLSEYGFGLNLLTDRPLTISTVLDSQPVTATLENVGGGSSFNGTYSIDSETITMGTSFVKVTTTGMWDAPLNILTIAMNDENPVVMSAGEGPTQGKITVGVGESPAYEYSFTITITPAGIVLDRGSTSEPMTWDELEALLLSDTAATWEKQASFASSIIGFIFNQLNFDINAITLIEENDTVLSKKSVTINGDTFPGTPPAGHIAQGTLILSSTDGNVGPGGDFSEVFNNYWVNDTSDDVDQLYEGSVSFVGFLRNADDARDVITAIGFIPNGTEDPGGVFFDGAGLTIYETQETSPGVFSIDDAATITITGGYSILFFEPTP
jgi:hypothetical protein